ncbi:hypothetical protein CQY22_005275 [Mycolicibacterium brumae]|uniref:Uncharacterized protein n=1 Tax=Mycolicibacterium brumae TaxID=85968 RepID=A0A2G5PEJ3_9MYCO|nr:hypothetical protein CQY22_005275 [Mycolicibacterium brumae]
MSLNWAGWRVKFVAVLLHDEIQGQLVSGVGAWGVYGALLPRATAPMKSWGSVGSPCIAGFRSVFLGDLVAVAEHVGDQRGGYLRGEFL